MSDEEVEEELDAMQPVDTLTKKRQLKEIEEATQRAKTLYGAQTLKLRDGMMSIFIKSDASHQVIHFNNVRPKSPERVGSTPNVEGILDLGSLRETLYISEFRDSIGPISANNKNFVGPITLEKVQES